MSIYTYTFSQSLCESLDIDFQEIPELSDHPMYGKRGQNNPKFGKHYGQMKKDVCPHCQKVVAINNIKRYHYENCRMKRNAN